MAITIQPACSQDAPEMCDVGAAAFANDLLQNTIFPLESATSEQVEEHDQWRIHRAQLRMGAPGKWWFKAVDESTASIVGLSGMYSPEADLSAHSSPPQPTCMNREVDDELRSKMKTTKEELMGDRQDYWCVASLAVHPDYQGRGLAKKLLQPGLNAAAEAGQDVYLEGTSAAQNLYKSLGFESLRDISMFDGQYILKAMIRHPRPVTNSDP